MIIHEKSAVTEVDYSDQEILETWLKNQPRGFPSIIAARAALRTLPSLAVEFDHSDVEEKEIITNIALPLFEALSVSWVAAKHPSLMMELKRRIYNAAITVKESSANSIAVTAILSSTTAATLAAAAPAPILAIVCAVDSVVSEAAAYAALYPASSISPDIEDALSAINNDIAYLQQKCSSSTGLAGKRLWLNGQPELLSELWEQLQERLLSVDKDWDIWTKWYEKRLMGGGWV